MSRRVLIVVGHPDPKPGHLSRALADAYAEGAEAAGHEVRRVDIATLDLPFLQSMDEFQHGSLPPGLKDAAEAMVRAQHIVFFFPLWLGTMPAMLKAFLEQVARPGIAFEYPKEGSGGFPKTLLKNHSARLVVTMGMPSFVYRFWFFGHGIAGLRRNILNFVGIKPVRETYYGMVEAVSDAKRQSWIAEMHRLGRVAK